ncbi:MAG: GTP-binding protein EngB [Chthoniobacteraceae bacterium]|nr:GTP-binding protein EngB [Chthoniobacteraceae bacterium]
MGVSTHFMKIRSALFYTSAPSLDSCPTSALSEFAFIGRSNVGKSSLLNMLAGKDGLAKVSATPGHTQLINFFVINDAWSLVDLPGYGYATTHRTERARFETMISDYLTKRSNLARVFVLIDSRHAPQTIDLEFVQWLMTAGTPIAFVFTKVDKSKPKQVQKNIELFREAVSAMSQEFPPFFTTSIETGDGRSQLLGFIEKSLEKTRDA